MLKEQKVLMSTLITIRENTDGYTERYICALVLYLVSVLSQCYSIIIDLGIIETVNLKEVVGGLNYIDNIYIYQLMSNVQLPGSEIFDS